MGILGIDIGGTNIRVGLVKDNELVRIESTLIKKAGSESDILNDLYLQIDQFSNEKISGIGIGVPSVVDVEYGVVYDVQNIPSWKEVHLKEILESKYSIPVYVNNDANCFAVGEKYFGKAIEYKNIIGLIIGTGLGAGIILNNKLYAGKNCGAGEFGMIPFRENNYEYYCSGQYFINEYGTTGKALFDKAKNKDAKALRIFKEFGSNLGEAIKMIMYSIDPEVIILGGSGSRSYQYFQDEMWKAIKSFAYSKSVKNIKIEISEIENIAILGAAALMLDANR
ncbi:MAG: ROK family protein [Ignavibacteriales bacterium]|nr:ROK family protein [Ignavibacteriales bacterium]